jgi:hypothetical protein
VLVHVFGAMLADREYPGNAAPGWLDSAFAITTIATIAALVLLALQFWVLRRGARRAPRRVAGGPRHLPRSQVVLAAMVVVPRAHGREADLSRRFLLATRATSSAGLGSG